MQLGDGDLSVNHDTLERLVGVGPELVGAQWRDLWAGRRAPTPEERLWFAGLVSVINDACGNSERLRAPAWKFINDRSSNFAFMCEVFGLETNVVKARLRLAVEAHRCIRLRTGAPRRGAVAA